MFKKGHNGYRKKGSKNLKRNPTILEKKSPQAIDKYNITKDWQKGMSRKVLAQADIEFYIYNDLPIDEYYDSLNLPEHQYINGNRIKEDDGDENV